MQDLKYIAIDASGIETPIVFPEFIEHSFFRLIVDHRIISAGRCHIYADPDQVDPDAMGINALFTVSCFDKSIAWPDKPSRGAVDALIIQDMLRRQLR